jgi:ABC transport system ATP-binding/permease protein
MEDARSPLSRAQVQIVTGLQEGRTFEIRKAETTLGRETTNDIILSAQTVSRMHACILWSPEQGWRIEARTNNNTLTINRQPMQQSPLKDHDLIGLGRDTTLLFYTLPPLQVAPTLQAAPPPQQMPVPVRNPTIEVSLPPQMQSAGVRGTQIAPPLGEPEKRGVPLLEISTNTRTAKQVYRLDQAIVNIGRDPSNDIVINEKTVSNFHAQIVREGDRLLLIHPHPRRQQTLNGLLYQGQKIGSTQQLRQELKRGDIFRIGDAHGTLVTLTYNDGSGNRQEALPDLHPIPLATTFLTLGRLPDNDVVLDHPQVSAHHARLEQVNNTYRIIDLGSTNHVYVNARQVKEQILKINDEVRIGPFRLTYTGSQLIQCDEGKSIRIDALHLNRYGNKDMLLLNDISLVIPPRKFVALVGGSGAGKSTLLNALSGLYPAQQGSVLYNGQDYYQNQAAFSSQLGYVPQDDIIHRDLTVERTLYYAARLRLPGDFTSEQIQRRIDEVLDDVEMKHRRKMPVSRLSGGQRKRVSIALELLANPSVFFLDEPTSGLDPGLDRKMMLLLRLLADRGHTIVLVTHATSNIDVCDYICFLAQGGHLAYFGPPDEARAFFEKSSFAEIYGALEPTEEQPDIPIQAERNFLASSDYQRHVVQQFNQDTALMSTRLPGRTSTAPQQRRRSQLWRQFWLLTLRSMELLKNDGVNLLILLLQAPVIGLILFLMSSSTTFSPLRIANCPTRANILATSGPIVSNDCQQVLDFFNTPQGQAILAQQKETSTQAVQNAIAFGSGADAQQILFIMAFAAVMFGCINAAREIVKEGPIYRRERTVNLGITPYMFSKITVLGGLCLLQSGILALMVNLKAPFQQGVFLPVLLEVYITLALTSLAGLMLGLAISALVPNTDRAMSFVPIVLIPQVIFSGVIFSLDGPATQAIGGLFAARWAIAALGSSLGLHADKLGVDGYSYCGTLFSTCSQQQAIQHLLQVWGALTIMIILLGTFVCFCLKRKDIATGSKKTSPGQAGKLPSGRV